MDENIPNTENLFDLEQTKGARSNRLSSDDFIKSIVM